MVGRLLSLWLYATPPNDHLLGWGVSEEVVHFLAVGAARLRLALEWSVLVRATVVDQGLIPSDDGGAGWARPVPPR